MTEEPSSVRVLASPAHMPTDGNPYIDLLYDAVRANGFVVDEFTRRRLLGRYDIVHVNWPAALVRWQRRGAVLEVLKVLVLLLVARRRGGTLVWTAHDIRPHDVGSPRLFGFFFWCFRRQVDFVVHLTASAKVPLDREYPDLAGKPSAVVRHGHYRDVYPRASDQERCRERLGLPLANPVALLVGQIRAYKQVPAFVRAVRETDTALHVAVAGGMTDMDLRSEIEELAASFDRCHLHLASLSPKELSDWVCAADILVLPYASVSALHSGVALLGLSLDRPVVVSPVPPMVDLQAEVGEEWIHLSDGTVDGAVAQATKAARGTGRPPSPDLSAYEWPAVGRAMAEAFRTARATRVGR